LKSSTKYSIALVGEQRMANDSVLLGLFEGIEDDVEVGGGSNAQYVEEERGLSRLKKAGQVETPPVLAETGRKEPEQEEEDEYEDNAEGEEEEEEEGYGGGYRDEEDEIEEQLAAEDGRYSDRDSEEDEEEEQDDLALIAGDGTVRGNMDAETQRLLREVATKDRLGKGHKVQIKALSGIVAKLKKKKESVVGKATQLRAPEAPSFDDILSCALSTVKQPKEGVVGVDDGLKEKDVVCAEREDVPVCKDGTITALFANAQAKEQEAAEGDDDEDDELEVIDDEDKCGELEENHEEFKLIEVPKLTPTKPSPLAFSLPGDNSGDMDDFEEEHRLIDDGAESDYEESDSDHSWAVHEDDQDGSNSEDNVDGPTSSSRDAEAPDKEGTATEGDDAGEPIQTFTRMKNVKDTTKKPKSNFIDEEAELSDEEGFGVAVSDDEDDDMADVDGNGELKDLIDTKAKDQNDEATEQLHIKWSRQQDAQQLKDILRGLENGFGRRNTGALNEFDGEMSGRRRRARADDDDDDWNGLGFDTAWPNLFGKVNTQGEDGEEVEDEIMLQKAQQRKIVESQTDRQFGSAPVPLDEDSQQLLEIFAHSASEPETLKRYRSRDFAGGSDPTAGGGLSFIGRQSKVQKNQNSSNLGVATNKSYVFGRKDSSSSRPPADDSSTKLAPSASTGPVDFSNLQQLTQNSNAMGNNNRKNGQEKKSSTLLHKLPRWNKPSNYQKSGSSGVIGAVCNQIANSKK